MNAPAMEPSFTPAEQQLGEKVARVIWFLNGLTVCGLAAWCL